MLRRLQNVSGKNIDVQMKADVAMVRGMLVQKNLATGKAILPVDQKNLFFVDRDVQPEGLMSYEGEINDYDERLEKIVAGHLVQLEKPLSGERFATDQFVAADLVIGGYVAADAQGKAIASVDATGLIYGGVYNDNGKTLAIIEVV